MAKEAFLKRPRYQAMRVRGGFSDEEMARDWTLSDEDKVEISRYRKKARLFVAVQICAVRLWGRLLADTHDLSPRISGYLGRQLELEPSLNVEMPERKATLSEQRNSILEYLGFKRFDDAAKSELESWIGQKAEAGALPDALFQQAESYLLDNRTLLPGATVLERLITHVCAQTFEQMFDMIDQHVSPELREQVDDLLRLSEGEQRSYFNRLKAFPPEASITSLKHYLGLYHRVLATGIDRFEAQLLEPAFLDFFFRQAKTHHAKDLKRFNKQKRYGLMVCFLLETRKQLLDYLVKMHDQYLTEMTRECKNAHHKKLDSLRKRKKKAIDVVLQANDALVAWPEEQALYKKDLWRNVGESRFKASLETLRVYQRLEERGYGDRLLNRYPSLRKYFADFIHLAFEAEAGNEALLGALQILRLLDSGDLPRLPDDVTTQFVPAELSRALRDDKGRINRNVWELSLALAMKDALRSGDLYLPESKQHVSFWNLVLSERKWRDLRAEAFDTLELPPADAAKEHLATNFHAYHAEAAKRCRGDTFAQIDKGKLKLKRDDKMAVPLSVSRLQKVIDTSMPSVRIEQLLIEVDKQLGFSRHFKPLSGYEARPKAFYKTLMATLVSQATNLGVVSMSNSTKDTSVDRLRHVLHNYVREETIKAASAEIVDRHHQLPLSSVYGGGELSSSDAQRFKIRASSLLASYYPRYYGYYEKAIGIYTHVSDQYSVFGTRAISCSPREALYVLDGLLENNTILQIKAHTTDTHGYTEIVFALCYLLGFEFMPRIRDLKDQQLYRFDKEHDYGVFTPLLTKTADSAIVEEQWDEMVRVAVSLRERTAPAHVVVQRLTSSFPADRLSKAFTNLGRIIKTQYVLRYLTDKRLRQTVQLQLNKGEYRHKLARRIFFADQGAFSTGDYEEIMNKASCLSLVSNAILYWNTLKISGIVEGLREQGEIVEDEVLKHISLLPYKHVVPNGTYFIEDYMTPPEQRVTVS